MGAPFPRRAGPRMLVHRARESAATDRHLASSPSLHAYRRHSAPRPALRELLEATLEWRGDTGRATGLVVDGSRYRLTRLTAGAGGHAVLCESAAAVPLPEYGLRRRLRLEIGRRNALNLAVFTDAAHSCLVWSWIDAGEAGERIYRELSFQPGQAWGPLRPVLDSLGASLSVCDEEGALIPFTEPGAGASSMLRALRSRIEGNPEDDRTGAQAVQDCIERSGVAALRDSWRTLLSVRVVDPCCDTGDWLEHAARALIAAYQACLERMGSEIDDLRRRRPVPRRESLGDFQRLVARAGGWRQRREWRRFAAELALLHNVFGIARNGSGAACRRRMARLLPGSALDPDILATNIRRGATGGQDVDGFPWTARAPVEVRRGAAVALRAVDLILRMHLDAPIDSGELGRAMTAAARRIPPEVGWSARIGPGTPASCLIARE